MAHRFQKYQDQSEEHGGTINVISLIDILFVLLIFFMVTTVFVDETGIDIEKPRAATQKDLEKNSILLGITSDGKIYHNGNEIGIGEVRSVVSRLVRQKEQPVIIQADRLTPTETTIAVLDEAKIGGAAKVFVSTTDKK